MIYPSHIDFFEKMNKEAGKVFWDAVQLPIRLGQFNANAKNLNRYYRASLKYMDSSFHLERFALKNEDYQTVVTFIDGIRYENGKYIQEGIDDIFWILPWFNFKVPIGSHTSYSSESISAIVNNSLILMLLQGVNPLDWIVRTNSQNSLFGYDSEYLVMITRYILAVCCFFYGKHLKETKDKITIEHFLWLCSMNLLHSLTVSDDYDIVKRELINRVIECNRKNFRQKYGKRMDKVAKATFGGNLTKGERHAISIKKYSKDVESQIYNLRFIDDLSFRKITETLNDKGIDISKSTVERIIKNCPAYIPSMYAALKDL